MDTKFWDNLIVGTKHEEEVAQFFESKGFNVWRIGSYKIPVDLFVWNDNKEFFIQVKFRSKKSYINTGTLQKCIKGEDVDCFLILITPDSSSVFLIRRDGTLGGLWCPSPNSPFRGYTNFPYFCNNSFDITS